MTIDQRTVLISGAGIAGATLAYWLQRHGFAPTVIERAPALRDSGQNVDVRGAGREVLRRMGLEDTVRDRGTGEVGLRFVDAEGRSMAEFPVGDSTNGDGPTAELEILRGELARTLVERCGDAVEFVYGNAAPRVLAALPPDQGQARREPTGACHRRPPRVVVRDGRPHR